MDFKILRAGDEQQYCISSIVENVYEELPKVFTVTWILCRDIGKNHQNIRVITSKILCCIDEGEAKIIQNDDIVFECPRDHPFDYEIDIKFNDSNNTIFAEVRNDSLFDIRVIYKINWGAV